MIGLWEHLPSLAYEPTHDKATVKSANSDLWTRLVNALALEYQKDSVFAGMDGQTEPIDCHADGSLSQ